MQLSVLFINCTLKATPQRSNTEVLINKVAAIYHKLGMHTDTVRLVDHNILPGVKTMMGAGDGWPDVLEKIKRCDICIIATPIWMGRAASPVQRMIERFDAMFSEDELKDEKTGQFYTYNKVAAALVTGNEDGAHESVCHILWAMQEYGFTIPPNANSYWVGLAGGSEDYGDGNGEKHFYTNKTNYYLVHNTIHLATILKQNPYPTNLNELDKEARKESK